MNKYKISRTAKVLTTNKIINHHFCPKRADRHKAQPFQGMVQMTAGIIHQLLSMNCSIKLNG